MLRGNPETVLGDVNGTSMDSPHWRRWLAGVAGSIGTVRVLPADGSSLATVALEDDVVGWHVDDLQLVTPMPDPANREALERWLAST
jgi:hypothetical protein